jgi:hypothetical protein
MLAGDSMLENLVLFGCLFVVAAVIVWGAGFGFRAPRLPGLVKVQGLTDRLRPGGE